MKLHLPIILTGIAFTLNLDKVYAEAVALEGQEFIQDSFSYFSEVDFKTHENHNPEAKNLLESANNFSVVFSIKDVIAQYDEPVNILYFFSDNWYAEGNVLQICLTDQQDGNWRWFLYHDGMAPHGEIGEIAGLGDKIYDATYVLRSGDGFVDLWRIMDGAAVKMISSNVLLDATDWSLEDEYYKVFRFGDEQNTSYLQNKNIESAILYNGLYDANGLIPTPGSGNIPEPATATLGLMALAGLVARRRRK